MITYYAGDGWIEGHDFTFYIGWGESSQSQLNKRRIMFSISKPYFLRVGNSSGLAPNEYNSYRWTGRSMDIVGFRFPCRLRIRLN
jgi:hypothetical protein